MKQNKDREEFEKKFINIIRLDCGKCTTYKKELKYDINLPDKLWSWIEIHNQKKVKEALNNILEENHCDLDGTYDYDGIAKSVIKLCKNK